MQNRVCLISANWSYLYAWRPLVCRISGCVSLLAAEIAQVAQLIIFKWGVAVQLWQSGQSVELYSCKCSCTQFWGEMFRNVIIVIISVIIFPSFVLYNCSVLGMVFYIIIIIEDLRWTMSTVNPRFKSQGLINFSVHNHLGSNWEY